MNEKPIAAAAAAVVGDVVAVVAVAVGDTTDI